MAPRKQQTVNGQAGLFDDEVRLLIPQRLAVEGKVLGSPVRQLEVPASLETCRLRPFAVRRVNGYETTLSSGETLKIISNKTSTELK